MHAPVGLQWLSLHFNAFMLDGSRSVLEFARMMLLCSRGVEALLCIGLAIIFAYGIGKKTTILLQTGFACSPYLALSALSGNHSMFRLFQRQTECVVALAGYSYKLHTVEFRNSEPYETGKQTLFQRSVVKFGQTFFYGPNTRM
jgi:hypothetical protein